MINSYEIATVSVVLLWACSRCSCLGHMFFSLFLIFYLFIFRERGKEGKRKEDKHHCVVVCHTPSTGDLAHNPGMCPGWESNQQPFDLQASAQSTESYQPGLRHISDFSFGCIQTQ